MRRTARRWSCAPSGERIELDATGHAGRAARRRRVRRRRVQRLAPGDKLVIYSDGVTEAQNTAAEFFGKKRLREAVAAHAWRNPARAIHDAIQEAVTAFTEGAPQSDDITVVVLEYCAPELAATE